MDQQKVDMFVLSNGSNLPEEQVPFVREKLVAADEEKWNALSTIQFKNPTTALILSVLLGGLGIDRFYIGDTGLGIGKLITCGGFGIWAIVDWFLIMKATRVKNLKKLQNYLF